MNISIVGTRGIPASYGGFETFAEEISVGLQRTYGHRITVVCHADKFRENRGSDAFKDVRLLYSRFSKDKNPLLFYLDSIILASRRSDIVYCCGPGGGMFGFIPVILKKTLVINPDGLNWKRSKWPPSVQKAFRLFEYLSATFSDYLVCDSHAIARYMENRYGAGNIVTIEYGAYPNKYVGEGNDEIRSKIASYGIQAQKYHLVVARLEPENNTEMIVKGYMMKERKHPLVIIGNAKNRSYGEALKRAAFRGVVFAGGIYDREALSMIRANALTYLHGHSVGGTNPSLLESLASGNICLCHDNEFNREVGADACLYYGSSGQLSDLLDRVEKAPEAYNELRGKAEERIQLRYNWELITEKYDRMFRSIGKGRQ